LLCVPISGIIAAGLRSLFAGKALGEGVAGEMENSIACQERQNCKFRIAAASLLLPLLSLAGFLGCGASHVNQPATAPGTIQFQGNQYPYAVFVPSTYDHVHALPAILLVHGGGGNGPDFLKIWQEFAEKNGIILVAPTLPLGAALEAQVPQLFPALVELVKTQWQVDSRRIYLFGYSAGGYSVFDAAMLDSSYFSAAGVFAAIITPDYYWIVQKAQRKTPIAMYIGDHDQFFSLTQTRATRDLLVGMGFPVHYVEIPNQDHNYPAIAGWVNQDVWTFMSRYSLSQ
jgi:predicted esterase